MSIYASWRGIDGDDCTDPDRRHPEYPAVQYVRGPDNPCPGCQECKTGAPFIYQGSHVLPQPDHPRGGSLGFASIHGDINNPDPGAEQEETVHPWLRFGLQQQDGDGGELVLSEAQVADLVEQLQEWLAWPKVKL
jgi:hypothetical protein